MKTLNYILCSFLLIMTSCNAQNKKDDNNLLSIITPGYSDKDSLSKPDVRFKVNKKYDEKGNIVSYDSTYSYSCSGGPGKRFMSRNDIFFHDFNPLPDSTSNSLFNFRNPGSFFEDPAFGNFFDKSYMEQQMNINQKMMNDFFQRFNQLQPPQPDQRDNKRRKEI